jgi:ligand-binding sensor domain-containing protein/two-component sensor histidine kinase
MLFKLQQSSKGKPYRWYLAEHQKITPLDSTTLPYKNFFDPVALRDVAFDKEGNAWYIKSSADSLFFFDHRSNSTIARQFDKITDNSQISFGSRISLINDKFFGCTLVDGGILYTNTLQSSPNNLKPKWEIALPGKHVTSIFYDRENNVWMGTLNGLYKFTLALNNLAVSEMPEKDTQTGINIELQNIFLTPGKIFLTTTGGGLFYTGDNSVKWKNLTWPSNSYLNNTWNIRPTNYGSFWIGTQQGLFEWQAGSKRASPLPLPPPWQWINSLPITTQFLDRENILWLGLGIGKGVAVFDLNTRQIKVYDRQNGSSFPLRYPVAIDEDEYGNVWMGGVEGRGLVCWDRKTDRFTLFPPEFKADFDNGIINAIYADHRAGIWLGTSGGLVKFDLFTKKFKKYSIQQGLSSNTIYSLDADNAKHLWIGTKNGLSCMDINHGKIVNFSGYYQNSDEPVYSVRYETANNKIYFITPHSFYSIIQGEWLSRRRPPQVFITSVTSSGRDLEPGRDIHLGYNNNNINIAFSAVNLVDGSQNKYFYRLNTQAKNWISTGSSRQISFSSLLPGQYTFEVKSQLPDGTWSKNQAAVSFFVAAPFWKTWWFILSGVVTFIAVIYLLYRYRIDQLMKLQIIRSRIASDLHDDIGSTLSNIHILTQLSHSNLYEPEKASGFLTRIAEEVNMSSQSLDDIVWSINTIHDNFEQMAARMRRYAAELFEGADIRYKVDFDEKLLHRKLNMEQRRDIYLIFKEALNNIYKHAHATSVMVTLKTDHQYFKMVVEDNGRGFDTWEPTTRNGLKNMQTRVKNYKGILKIESQKGSGTSLSIAMRIFQ